MRKPENVTIQKAVEEGGEAEIEDAPAAVDESEAEAENATDVLQEAEGLQAAEESEILSGADLDAEADAESEGITAEELAVEDVPDADETESSNE